MTKPKTVIRYSKQLCACGCGKRTHFANGRANKYLRWHSGRTPRSMPNIVVSPLVRRECTFCKKFVVRLYTVRLKGQRRTRSLVCYSCRITLTEVHKTHIRATGRGVSGSKQNRVQAEKNRLTVTPFTDGLQ